MKMIANTQIISLGFIALMVGACQQQQVSAPSLEAGPVVAQVGNTVVHEMDIDYEILSMPESMRHIMQDDSARAKVLAVMLKREAVAQKAKEMGLALDPLVMYRVRKAENAVLIESVKEWQIENFSDSIDDKVEAYYKKHKQDFATPEQVHARHILVASKQEAFDILKELKQDPDSFPALAAQYSIDDSNKSRGGDLNWFSKGVMVKPFEDAVFALNKKQRLSQPVKTDFGWHIIEWLGSRESTILTLEEATNEIQSILEKERMDKWVKQLIEDANIEILKSEYKM